MRLLTVLVLFPLLCGVATAKTLHVSPTGSGSDGLSWETAFPTVHAAIVAASSGDHVWVRSATYSGNIQMTTGVSLFGGFEGTETLEEFHLRDWERNPTVLAGGTPVLEAADRTIIEGFDVRNGVSNFPEGGGIFVHSATSIIQNCYVHHNRIAGIKCLNANVHIQDCTVAENDGGGIDITGSNVLIQDCNVINNTAGEGAGLEVRGSSLDMRGCWIVENRAESNTGVARGGGIYSSGATLILDRCVIARNVAKGTSPLGPHSDGGAVYSLGNVDATITNCLIEGNEAVRSNVFHIGQGSVYRLDSCTITNDEPISITGAERLTMVNSIFYADERAVLFGQAEVSFSNVMGGAPGAGNISSAPLFVDPANGDFRLQPGSPCIDSASMNGPPTDLDGNARPFDVPGVGRDGAGAFDMGAYEFIVPTPAPTFVNDRSDINRSGEVDALDLLILIADWKKTTDGAS